MRRWTTAAAVVTPLLLLLLCAAPRPAGSAAVLSEQLLRRLRADAGTLDPTVPGGDTARPYLREYTAALWRHGVRSRGQMRSLVERRPDLLPTAVSEPAALAALLSAWDGNGDGNGNSRAEVEDRATPPDHLDSMVRELLQAAADRLSRQQTAPTQEPDAPQEPVSAYDSRPGSAPDAKPKDRVEAASPRGIISVLQSDTSTSYIIHPDGPGGGDGVTTERLVVLGSASESGVRQPASVTDSFSAELVTEMPGSGVEGDTGHVGHSVKAEGGDSENTETDVPELVSESGGLNSFASDLLADISNSGSAVSSGAISSGDDGSSTDIPVPSGSELVHTTVPMKVLGITMPIGGASDETDTGAVSPASPMRYPESSAGAQVATGPVVTTGGSGQARTDMLDEPKISDDLHAFLKSFEKRQRQRLEQTEGGDVASTDAEDTADGSPAQRHELSDSSVGSSEASTEEDTPAVDSDDDADKSSREEIADGSAGGSAPGKVYPADPWDLYNSLFGPGAEDAEEDVGEDGSTVRSATPQPPPPTEPPPFQRPPPSRRPAAMSGFGSLAQLLMPLLDTFDKLKPSDVPEAPRPQAPQRPQGALRWRPNAGLRPGQEPETTLGRFPMLPPPPPQPADRPPVASEDMMSHGGVADGIMSHRMGPLEMGPTTPPNQPRPAVELLGPGTRRGPKPWLGPAIGPQNGHSQGQHPHQQFSQQFGQQPLRSPPGHVQSGHFDQHQPDQMPHHGPGAEEGVGDSQFAHRFGQRPFYETGRNPLLAGIAEQQMKDEVHHFSTMDLHRLREGGVALGGAGAGGGGRVPVVSLQLPNMLAVLPHGGAPVHLPPPRWVTEKVPPIVTKRLTVPPRQPPPVTVTESVSEPTTAASTEWEWVTTPGPVAETTTRTPPPPTMTTTPVPVTLAPTPRVSPRVSPSPVPTTPSPGEVVEDALRPYPDVDVSSNVVSHLTTTESGLEALGAIISGILGTASPAVDSGPTLDDVEGVMDETATGGVDSDATDAEYELLDASGELVGVGYRVPNDVDSERPSLVHHATERPHSGLAELDGLLSGTHSNGNRANHRPDGTDPGLRGRIVDGSVTANVLDTERLTPSVSDPEVLDEAGVSAAAARLSSSDIAYILLGTTAGVIVLCVTLVVVLVRGRRGGRLYKLFARALRSDYRQGLESRAGTSPDEPSPPPPPPVPALPARPPPPPVGLTTHKLGSWFNGKSETLGSEKFHSQLALPVPYASHAAPLAGGKQPRPHGYNLRQLVGGLTTQLLSSSSSGTESVVNTSEFDDTPRSRRAGRGAEKEDSIKREEVRGSYLFGGLMSPPGSRLEHRAMSEEALSSHAGTRHRRRRSEASASAVSGARSRGSRRSHSQPQSPELTGSSEREVRRRHSRSSRSSRRRSQSEQRAVEQDRRLTRPRARSPHPRRRARGSPDYRRRRRSERSQRSRETRADGHPRWPPRPDDGYSHGSGSPVEWSSNDERLI